MSKPRLIAFYLPQYYPIPENDEWWGKGFTEWTNVGSAKSLFKGHYQPKVPADLGYYDLRVSQTRDLQADLARKAGIEGFMYWHYWFNGRKILDDVFEDVVASGKPDYPFSLCWANHSWYKKTWKAKDSNKLLIEQTYGGEKDAVDHFNYLLPAFKDNRYIRVDGKLLFGIFAPFHFPDVKAFITLWNRLAEENGLNGFYFVALNEKPERVKEIRDVGYDAILMDYMIEFRKRAVVYTNIFFRALRKIIRNVPRHDYNRYSELMMKRFKPEDGLYPCIYPNFDHTPRSGAGGLILHNSTPAKWARLCRWTFDICKGRKHEDNLIFIKAWNEWGEGNYLEPDLKYGHGYLDKLKEELDKTL